ncbi:helix-turn-helix transcriptional regulator [Pseudonocardia spinosispora]|uniref:helix-turn-helix transcriptional regulator n=1 Tax=Pseudonocardia spinosispora TaxID=103441 RepID=UPI001B7F9953|nr:helix-turn-helix transcriptional regulator [Pseudonocardia spinosispora]
MWLWSSDQASAALRSRDLGQILRVYRRINGLSQERLAAVLGYDKTYISMIETRRRAITDVGALRHIAHTLGVPVHVLGVTEPDDATYLAMVQFAGSILSLADIARQSGRAVDAINELWPLVARLEARAADGFADRESLGLLGRARVSLGVALGTVLPDEKLSTAARWTGQALVVAERLDNETTLAHTLAMHGNELRKAGHLAAAVSRLRRAVALSQTPEARSAACAMLARAAGETGHAELFDEAIDAYQRQLDGPAGSSGMFGNRFTLREVQLRGLAATGRAPLAARLLGEVQDELPAAPQWQVIGHVTTGEVLLAVGDRQGAEQALLAAIAGATTYRLPHQIQRALRLANGQLDEVVAAGRPALDELGRQLAHPL